MTGDEQRDQLAAVLLFECGLTESAKAAREAVDALLPVVDAIATERAAAELYAAAAQMADPVAALWLTARADALGTS